MRKTIDPKVEKRQSHIKEMREKLERHTGQPSSLFLASDGGSESEETFLEQILAMEGVDEVPLFDALLTGGMLLPSPETLDDVQLTAKLWEVIHGMALLGHYLNSTDHLSDRQLYEHLWTEVLREPTSLIPTNPNFACHIDILGGCSLKDIQNYLKYYADDDERRDWAKNWPDDEIPAQETPPYDRDRHLPQPPFCTMHSRDSS